MGVVGCSPFRVKKPVQNPTTHPRTIENCSRASNEPRVSGELISAMYKGESMLCHQKCQKGLSNVLDGTSRGQVRLYLSAPTPRPPMALPAVICVNERAHVCKAEPMQKTASTSRSQVSNGMLANCHHMWGRRGIRTTCRRDRRPS